MKIVLKADGIGLSVNYFIYQNVIGIESDGTSDGLCYAIVIPWPVWICLIYMPAPSDLWPLG